MPTHYETEAFRRAYSRLTPEQRRQFTSALEKFVNDLREMETGKTQRFRPGLRVRSLKADARKYEMMGWRRSRGVRLGTPQRPGFSRIEWLDIGGHEILPYREGKRPTGLVRSCVGRVRAMVGAHVLGGVLGEDSVTPCA